MPIASQSRLDAKHINTYSYNIHEYTRWGVFCDIEKQNRALGTRFSALSMSPLRHDAVTRKSIGRRESALDLPLLGTRIPGKTGGKPLSGGPAEVAELRNETMRKSVATLLSSGALGIPEAELDRFLNAGFSEQQFEAVISRIQRSKAQASCCKNGPQPGHVHALA